MKKLPFNYQKKEYWEFYCPACKTLRRSFYWPSPRKHHYISVTILGLTASLLFWPWLGFKAAFFVFPLWGAFELIYRSRSRIALICPHCSFDPYLYKYDVKLARKKMEKFFADKTTAREKRKAVANAAATTATTDTAVLPKAK